MELLKDLQWRYATKAYTDKKVSNEKLDFILEAINLTASSCGLQPYRGRRSCALSSDNSAYPGNCAFDIRF